MATRQLPPIELLRQLLRYEPETGKLYWKERAPDVEPSARLRKSWNTQYSGKEAFTYTDHHGYRVGNLLGRPCRAHRIIWAIFHGVYADGEIDHLNGDKSDNRIANLRVGDRSQNNKNLSMMASNTSGRTGVYWHNVGRGGWRARIKHNGKQVHLGVFENIDDAAAAYEAAKARFGYTPRHGTRKEATK